MDLRELLSPQVAIGLVPQDRRSCRCRIEVASEYTEHCFLGLPGIYLDVPTRLHTKKWGMEMVPNQLDPQGDDDPNVAA